MRKLQIAGVALCSAFIIAASGCTGNEAAWKTAYKEVVTEWNEKHAEDDAIGYELAYINDDDIPELALFCDDEAWYAMDMYTFENGKAVRMQTDEEMEEEPPYLSLGWQGKGDDFCEKTGIYFQSRGMMGDHRTNAFRMEGDKFKRIIFYDYYDLSWDESLEEPPKYILEYTDAAGKDVSVEKNVSEDVDYSDMAVIPEAKDLEKEFGFSFSSRKALSDEKVSYDEIIKALQ